MKNAKDIITIKNLTRLVIGLAVLLTLMAIFVVVMWRGTGDGAGRYVAECRDVVVVASGDTLSKLLSEQG